MLEYCKYISYLILCYYIGIDLTLSCAFLYDLLKHQTKVNYFKFGFVFSKLLFGWQAVWIILCYEYIRFMEENNIVIKEILAYCNQYDYLHNQYLKGRNVLNRIENNKHIIAIEHYIHVICGYFVYLDNLIDPIRITIQNTDKIKEIMEEYNNIQTRIIKKTDSNSHPTIDGSVRTFLDETSKGIFNIQLPTFDQFMASS